MTHFSRSRPRQAVRKATITLSGRQTGSGVQRLLGSPGQYATRPASSGERERESHAAAVLRAGACSDVQRRERGLVWALPRLRGPTSTYAMQKGRRGGGMSHLRTCSKLTRAARVLPGRREGAGHGPGVVVVVARLAPVPCPECRHAATIRSPSGRPGRYRSPKIKL